jgi:hypothetical protein
MNPERNVSEVDLAVNHITYFLEGYRDYILLHIGKYTTYSDGSKINANKYDSSTGQYIEYTQGWKKALVDSAGVSLIKPARKRKKLPKWLRLFSKGS